MNPFSSDILSLSEYYYLEDTVVVFFPGWAFHCEATGVPEWQMFPFNGADFFKNSSYFLISHLKLNIQILS